MRNLVALLLASYISTEQFAHYLAKAEGEKATQSLKQVGGKGHHDQQAVQIKEEESDSDSDDDKQNVEEASDSGSDSDSGDDEAAKKEQAAAHETAPKTEAKQEAGPTQTLAQSRDRFGRDANGDYLDQKSYVKKRNALNEKEESHRSMYNSVTEKLDDPVYVQNALQTASSVEQQVAEASKQRLAARLKEADAEMTDEGARCYIDRYPDLEMFNTHFEPAADPLARAKMHWLDFGKEEGRNPWCAPKITEQQARCYWENYPDLQKGDGAEFEKAKERVTTHWYKQGFLEGRTYACSQSSTFEDPEDYKAYKCGNQGELCQCTGQIYYAKLYNEGNKAGVQVNTTETVTSNTTGTATTIQHSTVWTSSDPDANSVTTTTVVDSAEGFIQLDVDGPFNKDNDPYEKYRKAAEVNATEQSSAPPGAHLLQLEGPFDRSNNPFEKFRRGPSEEIGMSGSSSPPAKKAQPMTFVEAVSWKYNVLTPPKGSLMCGASVMGDPHPGHKMQCFCEPYMPKKPKWCAKQGQDCKCKGNVFIGNANSASGANTTFEDMLKDPYYVKKAGSSQGSLNCSIKAFGFDPNPGIDKHCYCDADLTYNQTLIDQDLAQFQAERDEAAAKAAELRAAEERKRAEEEAKAAAAAAEAAIKAARAERKKREKEILAAQEAAIKKAEDEENAAREAAQAKEKAEQEAAQAAAVAAAEAEHQAELERLQAEQEENDLKHAKSMKAIQQRLNAHEKKAAAEKRRDQQRMRLFQANQRKMRAQLQSRIEQQRAKAKRLEDKIEAARLKSEQMAKQAAEEARIRFKKQREAAIRQRELAEKERIQRAIQAKIALAIAEFQKKQAAKEAAIDAEIERKLKEKEAREKEEARKRAEEKERQRLAKERAAEEARLAKEAAEREKKRLEEEQKQEELRKKKLEEEARQARLDAEKARHDQLEAQKKEELAKNEQEAREAREAAAKAAEAAEKAERARNAVQREKEEIQRRIQQAKAAIDRAEKAEAEAQARTKAAEQRMERLQKQQEAAQAQFEKDKQAAEDRVKAKQAQLAERAKKNAEMLAELARKQEERQKAAQIAAQKAHEQAIEARKLQQANQEADHKRRLEARRAQFSSEFGHVWISGPTGAYLTHLTVQDQKTADHVIENLFFENIVADARTFKDPVSRHFLKHGHQIVEDGEHKIVMVTSDDRTQDLVKTVGSLLNNEKFDLVFIPISTGNKNYFEWVGGQTIKRSAAQSALQSDETEVPDDQIEGGPSNVTAPATA